MLTTKMNDQDGSEDYSESGGFPVFSFVSTSEEAHSVIEEYEIRTTSRFSCYVAKKDFGNTDFSDSSRKLKVMWEDFQDYSKTLDLKAWRLAFDGVPFLSLSWKKFDCHHGHDRKVPMKERRKETVDSNAKKRSQVTKKLGCPAKIILREIIKFPNFKICQDTHWYRHEASKKLRSAIKAKTAVGERRIYIYLPKINEHKQHLTGAAGGITQRLDSQIKLRIQALSAAGERNIDDIKKDLHRFVVEELFQGSNPPPLTNRRFYPTKTDIRNHLYLAKAKQVKNNTLTPGKSNDTVAEIGGHGSTSVAPNSRKRKLNDTVVIEPIQLGALKGEYIVAMTSSSQLTDNVPCPEHITEVEISSNELVNPTNTGYFIKQIGDYDVNDHATAGICDLITAADISSIKSGVIANLGNTLSGAHVSIEESSLSIQNAKAPLEVLRDHELNLVEHHSQISNSTVIDNLNLITQAMDAKMQESSQGPFLNDKVTTESKCTSQVTMETISMATAFNNAQKQVGTPNDNKSRMGARCRSILGQIRHLTDLVEDDSVLTNVQDQLLGIVQYMESHVPVLHVDTTDTLAHQVKQYTTEDVPITKVELVNTSNE